MSVVLGAPRLRGPARECKKRSEKRDITLVQSVERKAVPVPGGGRNPSMSYYANYVVFDSPAPLGSTSGAPQIFMRYLGPV